MNNQWLRLWHDLPNDPKWRTIARVSGEPISSVISVFVHMLVCASTARDRGRLEGWNDEDIASALDLETEQVTVIYQAMQGRVLDDDKIRGWEKRQPIREDGSAERAKAWREAKKRGEAPPEIPPEREETQANASERTANAAEPPDKIRIDTETTTTTPSEPPTEEEPDPTPPVEPPRSSRDFESENSEQRAEPQPVADTVLHGTVTQDELIFPNRLNPIEVVSAFRLVCLFTLLDAQQLLDELAWRLDPRHNPVHSPISFLRTLCERHKVGAFCPSGALKIQSAREAARCQAAREAASRQQAPRGGGADPPRKAPTAEIANIRAALRRGSGQALRPHRPENTP